MTADGSSRTDHGKCADDGQGSGARCHIGIDVGGTKINSVTLRSGRIIDRLRVPTPRSENALLAAVAGATAELTGRTVTDAPTVGVGIAGMVDRDGCIVHSPNLAWMDGVDVASRLNEAIGAPVSVENDANAAAFAEWKLGAGVGETDFAMVSIGTGIGGGIIVGNRLLTGANGFAGEIGHIPVIADGPACACGGRGHWEAIAAGPALGQLVEAATERGELRASQRVLGRRPTATDLELLVREQLAEVRGTIDRFADAVARGLETLVAILDPAVLILGGGVMDIGPVLLDAIGSNLEARVEGGSARQMPDLRLAQIGSDAAAVGAALLGAERCSDNRFAARPPA
ncbi:MAG: ROK family protein [Actinobacteria bacterium]|nr:ROK family protein [Actinomycetota bacterium]MCB9388971.1 ROK family protein [Acidimicrobiia bacterium]